MREWFRNWRWALAASLFLHVLIAAFLFYGLPRPEQSPDQQEQPVNVAIVPPPEQPKPKPAPKPPEPKPEKPPEQKVEKPPPPEQPKPSDIPVLKRVFQYGEKDTGPEKALDGGSAPANGPSPAKEEAAKPPPPKPEPGQPAEQQADSANPDQKPATTQSDAEPSEEKQSTEDADKQPDKQQAAPQTAERQTAGAPKPLAAEASDKPAPPSSAENAKPKPAKPIKFKSAGAFKAPSGNARKSSPTNTEVAGSPVYGGLPGVRKLYSQGATGDVFATSSMENVPRGQRVANLCGNILDQELQGADYSPKWVPTIRLDKGNILNPPDAAFSTRKQWYSLSFRCEVDADATRVLSFNFHVGPLIPPGEWARRGFTKYPLD